MGLIKDLGNKIQEQTDKYGGSVSDAAGDALRGDFSGIFDVTADFFTLGAYSKINQIIDAFDIDIPEQDFQDRQQMATGSSTPRQFVYGNCRIGGQLTYWEPTGADSEFMHMIVTLAPHGLNSIKEVYFGDKLAIDANGTPTSEFTDIVTISKVTDPRTTALPEAVAALEEWSESHILKDHAYIYLTLKYNRDAYDRGMPNVSCVVEGKNDIYDPRSGSFGYTRNHALVVLDQLLNVNGFRVEADEYLAQTFIDGADICDEQVPAISGTEPRYTVDGTLSFAQAPTENMVSLLKSGAAVLNFDQGVWQYVPGAYIVPLERHSFNESDLVGGVTFQSGASKADIVNTAKGSFLDPDQDFEKVQYLFIQPSAYVDLDGEELAVEVNAPFSTSSSMARRLAKLQIEQSRFGLRCQVSLKMHAMDLIAGDRITLSIARLGWVDKVFRVIPGGSSLSLDSGVQLSLVEDAPSVWDWTEGEALAIAPPPALILPDQNINAPTDLAIVESLYTTTNSAEVKTRALFSWVSGGVRSVIFEAQYRPTGGEFEVVATDWRDTQIMINDTQLGEHEFRVRGVTGTGRASEWSNLVYTVVGKETPPADIGSLTATQKSHGIDLNWTPVADLDVKLYELRVDENFGDVGAIYSGLQTVFTDIRRVAGVTYYVRALDTSGNYSDASAVSTPVITGPSQVATLTADSIVNNAQLFWSTSDSIYPIQAYHIRKGETFASSVFLAEVSGTFFTKAEDTAGTFRYWVQPFDAVGQSGPALSAIASVDEPSDYLLRADDFIDLATMDTLTDMAVGSGGGGLLWSDTITPWDETVLRWDNTQSADLIGPANDSESFGENMTRSGLAAADPLLSWDDTTQLWDETTLGWDSIGGDAYGEKEANGFLHWLNPSVTQGVAEETVDFGALIASTRITVFVDYEHLQPGATLTTVLSVSDDDITYVPFADNQLVASASNFQYLRINLTIDAPGGEGMIKVNSVRYKLDVKQKTDQGQAAVLASDTLGTEVIFNKTFLDIDSVTGTARDSLSKTVVITFDDVGNQDRCKIFAFLNSTGARVDADVSWITRGS